MPKPRKHAFVGGRGDLEGNRFDALVFHADGSYFVAYDATLTFVAFPKASKTLARIVEHGYQEVPPLDH